MRRNEPVDLFSPQRQSIAAILIILLKFGRNMVRQFWPVLIVLFLNKKGSRDVAIGIAVGLFGLVSLFGSIIAYFKFYFYIRDGELNVRRGVFRRVSLNVPFERIQSIDFEQNLIHQLFGVVAVKVDTAGSKSSELEIDAVSKDVAYALRAYILREKAAIRGTSVEHETEPDTPEEKKLVLSLEPADLLKIGISQNHFRTGIIILGVFLGFAQDLGDAFGFSVSDRIEEEVGQMLQAGFFFIIIFIPVFIFISFLVTLVRTVFKYFDLKFWQTPNGFKLVSGLFTRVEKSMQKEKIQIIGWSNNPIKRLFGIFRLRIYQAASVDVVGNKSMIIPGAYLPQVEETISSVIPGSVGATYEEHGIDPVSRFRFIWFFGLLPLLLLTGLAWYLGQTSWYLAWAYFPVSIWMGHQYYVKRGFQLHPEYFISLGGIFGRSHKMIEIFKVQAVKVSQGWFETRRDLATIHIYTAAGEIRVPYLPLDKARQLQNYLLYKAESTNRHWI